MTAVNLLFFIRAGDFGLGPGEIPEAFTEQMTFELVCKLDCCVFQVDKDVKAEEESVNLCSVRAPSRLTPLLWSEMFFLIKTKAALQA
uniref:Uncharacterized protein n=1 Tax=Rangifer tarandus platyrhynchus TaxID=3082113 RepID=A0ACB0DTL2_RANTA|nr:unnamed protein product [Rangifer tarandus platyrhynchus]